SSGASRKSRTSYSPDISDSLRHLESFGFSKSHPRAVTSGFFHRFNRRKSHPITRIQTLTEPAPLKERSRPEEDFPKAARTSENPSQRLRGSGDRPGSPASLRLTGPVLPSAPCARIRDGF